MNTNAIQQQVFDYQSDRHYSKTDTEKAAAQTQFDYQSDRHYSKTVCQEGT